MLDALGLAGYEGMFRRVAEKIEPLLRIDFVEDATHLHKRTLLFIVLVPLVGALHFLHVA